MSNTDRTLSRDVTATQIPSGDKHTLAAGTKLFIHQTLGGSYTVQTDFGLFRLDGKDADAIGETVVDHSVQAATLTDGAPDPAAIWDQLKRVYDPEIPVNIVDLGLVYSMDVEQNPDVTPPSYRVNVAMTLTAPGCGMGPILVEDVRGKVSTVPNVSAVAVELTFDPPWNSEMMSEAARLQTGMY
jgi:probable FeS assembly SUF system protein SufT